MTAERWFVCIVIIHHIPYMGGSLLLYPIIHASDYFRVLLDRFEQET